MAVTVDIAAAKSILPAPEVTSSAVKKGIPAQYRGGFLAPICFASLVHNRISKYLFSDHSTPDRTLRKYEERLIFIRRKAGSFAVAGEAIPDRSKVDHLLFYPASLDIHRRRAGMDL